MPSSTAVDGTDVAAPDVDNRQGAAADVIWATASPELFILLTRERGWAHQTYEQWLADSCTRLLRLGPPSHQMNIRSPVSTIASLAALTSPSGSSWAPSRGDIQEQSTVKAM